MKYNYWTTTEKTIRKHGELYIQCVCKCGTIKYIKEIYLKKEVSKSCGCMKSKLLSEAAFIHGQSGQYNTATKTYNSWHAMIQRCININHQAYHNYGARGITVCNRWRKFENFFSDMGERPPECELDRIDVNGNYEPKNCRWVSKKENSQNTRYSKRWIINGIIYNSARDAAKTLKVGVVTIRRWCNGGKVRGKLVPPKPGCTSYLAHKENKNE